MTFVETTILDLDHWYLGRKEHSQTLAQVSRRYIIIHLHLSLSLVVVYILSLLDYLVPSPFRRLRDASHVWSHQRVVHRVHHILN